MFLDGDDLWHPLGRDLLGRGVSYGAVAPVLAACRRAGVDEIALATDHGNQR